MNWPEGALARFVECWKRAPELCLVIAVLFFSVITLGGPTLTDWYLDCTEWTFNRVFDLLNRL